MLPKILNILYLDITCSLNLTVFLKLHSWKNVHSSEQIMSVGKHPSIFLHQMEAIVYILPKQSQEEYSQWSYRRRILVLPSIIYSLTRQVIIETPITKDRPKNFISHCESHINEQLRTCRPTHITWFNTTHCQNGKSCWNHSDCLILNK